MSSAGYAASSEFWWERFNVTNPPQAKASWRVLAQFGAIFDGESGSVELPLALSLQQASLTNPL